MNPWSVYVQSTSCAHEYSAANTFKYRWSAKVYAFFVERALDRRCIVEANLLLLAAPDPKKRSR